MLIEHGDILSVESGIIAHGCNARSTMGSGVALQLKTKYPAIFSSYKEMCSRGNCLGMVDYVIIIQQELIIANCITQEFYGRDSKRYVSYDAVDEAFSSLATHQRMYPHLKVYFPMIGGGLGNGDPNILMSIFSAHFPGPEGVLFLHD